MYWENSAELSQARQDLPSLLGHCSWNFHDLPTWHSAGHRLILDEGQARCPPRSLLTKNSMKYCTLHVNWVKNVNCLSYKMLKGQILSSVTFFSYLHVLMLITVYQLVEQNESLVRMMLALAISDLSLSFWPSGFHSVNIRLGLSTPPSVLY